MDVNEALRQAREEARNRGRAGRRRRNHAFRGFLTSAAFLALMKPPDYLIAGLLLRGATLR